MNYIPMKMFLIKEQLLPEEIFTSAIGNQFGALLLPYVNAFANDNLLNPNYFPHYNLDLQNAVNVYPGELFCNTAALPHAKWHLQTGIALVDFVHLTNLLNKVVMPQGNATITSASGGEKANTNSASGLTRLPSILIIAAKLMAMST